MNARTARLIRYGTAFALTLVTLLGLSGPPDVRAREDDRTKEIREVEKKLAELQNRLAALKAANPNPNAQKPLTLKDALAWKSITRAALTRDGQWFAGAIVPGEGKGEVLLKQVSGGGREKRFPAGEAVGGLAFADNNAWLAFTSMPKSKSGRRTGPGAPAPGSEPPTRGKLALVNLATGDTVEYDGVTRFAFSGEAATTLALYQPPAPPTPTQPTGPTTGPRPSGAPEQPASSRLRGGTLILRDLATGKELTLGHVADFAFDKKGERLALTIDAPGQLGNGVQLRDMKTGVLTQLDSGKATYQSLGWTEKGDAFALLKSTENKGYKDKRASVLVCTNLDSAAPGLTAYDPAGDTAFPKGMVISTAQAPRLSEDLSTVFFGVREPRKDDPPAAKGRGGFDKKQQDPTKGTPSAAKDEKPDLVIWHGKDDRLQAQQQVEAGRDQDYSYLCAYRLGEKKLHRLADDGIRSVTVAPKGRFAVGSDRRAYERSGSLDGKRYQDVHVMDVRTGERHLALKKDLHLGGFSGGVPPASLSPDGTKLLYYDDGQYHVYDMAERKSRCITKDVPTSFVNTEDDHNVDRPPVRPVGWAKDSTAVLLSDNWDIWRVPVADGPVVNLTVNGKKDGIRYTTRLALDPEEKGIDLDKPIYVVAIGEWTKKSGYVRIDPKGPPTVLCWDDAGYGGNTSGQFGAPAVMKARDADVYVFTRETLSDFPDYYATDGSFKSPRRLTNANPERSKYAWSSGSLLVDYESAKGDRLQGALYLPANYEKGKKYPTIVYIYEKLSQGKNRYLRPSAASGFNPAIYTSNGYAVFTPDIRYKVNDPGMSAVWCVLPALEAAIATGVVDRDRVGLQGHSWGGYQTAFLITQTPAFKAAVAGAPLTNLVSMYSSVYWNTGWANQPIFESSQGRFTGGYWEQQEAYLRNSPVFHAKNVKTPLMLLHNDKDGAVDFNQGIEYFNTLRRLDKPVVMLQYKGENHGLVKPANQKDYARRMREFFDHHLMGKPAPAWLEKGVPHLKMDEHLKERAEGS